MRQGGVELWLLPVKRIPQIGAARPWDRSAKGLAATMRQARGMPLLLLHLLLAWMTVAQARFVVEENSITVTSPSTAAQKTYNSAIGNFGVPHYGGTLLGNVVYPSQNPTACVPFSTSFKSATPGGLPTILLTDRGECFFAKKVWNAQQAGAAAVLVADDRPELLITMDQPDADADAYTYLPNITIPSALIEQNFGDQLKKWLADKSEMVTLNLDWRESLPHPDNRVEYEFWTNSNDQCGPKCDTIMGFLKDFKGAAEILEQGSYAEFTPHYITWYCPQAFIFSKQCKAQCINNGRYCAPDPEQDFTIGYDGKDVVKENLRQLCVFKVGKEKLQKPWVWWDYVTDFQIRCPMKEQKYNKACAEEVIKSLGLPLDDINACIGDPDANVDNEVLKKEQDAQVGQGDRGDVTILPTLIINQRQYRGKLERTAVLKGICSGFQEATEPAICLNEDMETNECLNNNGGCWQNTKQNITACKDTFRGRVCQCPSVGGVQFQGDGYSSCEPIGTGRCTIDNGGCWKETKDSVTFSACSDVTLQGCQCPSGFKGDGVSSCIDIDECAEKTACTCPQCSCKNTWGGFDCSCTGSSDLLYIREHDTCISKSEQASRVGWVVTLIVFAALAVIGVSGYIVYKYRLRSYMDSEIRAIMAQYMPLDSQGDALHHLTDEDRI